MADKQEPPKNGRVKAPSFQFYPNDWLTDQALQLCTLEEKGLWMDLLCHMHNSSKPGYLQVNGVVLTKKMIRKLVNTHPRTFDKAFMKLESYGVISFDEKEGYHSKRMVKDEALRSLRRQVGALGGNPNLVNQKDNQNGNQNPTPSSSSSSSLLNQSTNVDGAAAPEPQGEILKEEEEGPAPPLPVPVPPQASKENKKITGMIEALKQTVRVPDFKESKDQQRIYGRHFLFLISGTKDRKPIPGDEIKRRLTAICMDDFKAKNRNSIRFLYREVKAWVEPPITSGVIVSTHLQH